MVFLSLLVELITAPPGEALRAQTHPHCFLFRRRTQRLSAPRRRAAEDYVKMEEVARTIYMTLWAVANLPSVPKLISPCRRN